MSPDERISETVVLTVHSARDLRAVRDSLAWLPLPLAVVADVVLVASEVVTNALQYADGPCEFRARYPTSHGGVRVEVSDSRCGPLPAPLDHVRTDALRGRGLHIVDTLASRWGVFDEAPHGKIVWFEVDLAVHLAVDLADDHEADREVDVAGEGRP